jgi:hypothetical protein
MLVATASSTSSRATTAIPISATPCGCSVETSACGPAKA